MHKQYVFAIFVAIWFCVILSAQHSSALSTGLVISQVQTRSLYGGSASEELIEIYNNSNADIDITNWCVKYGSTGTTVPTKTLTCFNHSVPKAGNYVFLSKRSPAVLISKTFTDLYPNFGYDSVFSSGLRDSDRWVSISDATGAVIDIVEWGTVGLSSTAEGNVATVLPLASQLIQRKMVTPGELQDTNNNFNDFESAKPRTIYSYGLIYEQEDLCLNIDGIQLMLPYGLIADENRNCGPVVIDVCSNLDGIQTAALDGYTVKDNRICMLDLPQLKITELLPNPVGADEGNEFIEIYNPNDKDANLSRYVLYIGDSNTKFDFPTGSTIKAGQYLAFSNSDIKFTLVNTISKVALRTIDNQSIDETPTYNNPDEGSSWALIDGIWQYTNRPTPGETDTPSLVEEATETNVVIESNLASCAANQYRSPDTNRCRLIVTSSSTLSPCKDGQYRSEETNRCRSIASDAGPVTACDEGQERNPDTNRCRSIGAVLGVSDLAPCKEGQERNPDTNRCRNIASPMPQAEYAPEQTAEASNNYILWWSLAAVGLVAIGYGVWEWRREFIFILSKIKILVSRKTID